MTPGETRDDEQQDGLAVAAVRLLVREATRAPLAAITLGLQAWERSRGLREAIVRNGDTALQLAAHTPLGRFLPQPVIDDNAEAEGLRIAADARQSAIKVATPPEPKPRPRPTATRQPEPRPERPTGQRAAVSEQAREAGAPGAVSEQVDRVTAELSVAEPASREDLPIPDFDNVSLASLRARLRSLSLEQLVTLREWERSHADRLPVRTLLDNRIAKLAADAPVGPPPAYPAGESAPTAATPTAATPTAATAPTAAAAARQAERAAEDEGGTLRV